MPTGRGLLKPRSSVLLLCWSHVCVHHRQRLGAWTLLSSWSGCWIGWGALLPKRGGPHAEQRAYKLRAWKH